MKKIFLTCAVLAMTIFATEAQSKKSSSKKKTKTTVSAESKLKTDIAKSQAEKKLVIEEQRVERLKTDSVRKEEERLVEEKKAMDRIVWKEQKLKEVDSLNQVKWKQQVEEKDQEYATERSQRELSKAAKLNDNQGQQVKLINQTYNNKAKAIREDLSISDEQKKAQLTVLNAERRAKIKAAVGSNKEKNLEKERVKYSTKNNDDKNSAWINEVVVNKK